MEGRGRRWRGKDDQEGEGEWGKGSLTFLPKLGPAITENDSS